MLTSSDPKPAPSHRKPSSPKSRLGEEMQEEQDRVREILKIKDPHERHKALKQYAKKSKSEFSEEPDTEVLNLSLMQPRLKPSFAPKPKPKVVQEPEPVSKAKEKPKLQVTKPKRLKDSIYFQTDEDYEEYLQQTLKAEGLFEELYEQMKVLYVSRKNIPALSEVWKHLDELELTPYQASLEQAETLIQMEAMEQAFIHLDRAVRMEPDNLKGIRAIALYHKLNREYELAVHWLEKWKKLSLEDAEVYYHMGSVYRRTGMREMAITELRRCLSLNANHVMARSLLEKMNQ